MICISLKDTQHRVKRFYISHVNSSLLNTQLCSHIGAKKEGKGIFLQLGVFFFNHHIAKTSLCNGLKCPFASSHFHFRAVTPSSPKEQQQRPRLPGGHPDPEKKLRLVLWLLGASGCLVIADKSPAIKTCQSRTRPLSPGRLREKGGDFSQDLVSGLV